MQRIPCVFALLVALGGSACGEGGDPDAAEACVADEEINVEDGLPDSEWSGTLRYTDSQGEDSVAEWRVAIADNIIRGDMRGSEQTGETYEKFDFHQTGQADWIDFHGEVVGSCKAAGGSFNCTHADQEVVERVFCQDVLAWSRQGSYAQISFAETGTLTRVR